MEVAIRERRPEDVVVASLEGVAVDAAYADDALLGPSCTRALVRPASNDHASFEWARRSATTTAEPNAAEDDEKDDVQDETRPLAWCRYAFPATTLACSANESSARDNKNGETLLECFLALLKEGALAFVFAKYSEEDEERVPSRRLDVCLAADAFADAPAFAEHASRRKKHARLRRVLGSWLCPPVDDVERFAAGLDPSTGSANPPRDAPTFAPAFDDATKPAATGFSQTKFSRDAATHAAYAAAKPPREAPAFAGAFPGLAPDPRPYQRRAVHWMVRREKGGADAASKVPETRSDGGDASSLNEKKTQSEATLHPLWSPLRVSDTCASGASCFVNWYTGQVSRFAFPAPPDVKGGILADEMGLGKTVELLMCILAHRYEGPGPNESPDERGTEPEPEAETIRKPTKQKSEPVEPVVGIARADDAKGKRDDADAADADAEDVVGCACGVEGVDYDGLWLRCESCAEWSHARCVGYTKADEKKHAARVAEAARAEALAEAAEREALTSYEEKKKDALLFSASRDEGDEKRARDVPGVFAANEKTLFDRLQAAEATTRTARSARERAEEVPFTCGRCVARRAGRFVSGPCGATLVVCPSAILAQWRSELERHASPGSLAVVTYEGQPRGASGPDAKQRSRTVNAPVSALDLARADVVLTTYETLRNDLHHAPAASPETDGDSARNSRASRHRKKYEIIPTPLTRLTWWRVVLDEAQEVESSTAAAAAMARLVPGVHRWAVTGTPVSRGLEDLQGLFAFLNAPSHLADAHWWRRVVEAPFERRHAPSAERLFFSVLRRVMWRNARADVADELRLPPQGQTITALRPSGIEAHWYRKQREVCERAAREALRRVLDPARARAEAAAERERNRRGPANAFANAVAPGSGRRLGGRSDADRDGTEEDGASLDDDDDDDDAMSGDDPSSASDAVDLTADDDDASDRRLTADESRRVLAPLLRLRQACNHPQAGTHGVRGLAKGGAARGDGIHSSAPIGAGGIHSGAIMSMPQIHAVLIEKQRVEAEEAQRLVAFTLNASAGVAFCKKEYGAAVEHYRRVLKLEASGAADGLGLRLDALQRLHALHNLRLALDAADEAAKTKSNGANERGDERSAVAVSRSLRDDSLLADAETERRKYLLSRAGGVGAAAEHLRKTSASVSSALSRCGATNTKGPAGCAWWVEALALARRSDERSSRESALLFDRLVDGALQGSWQGERVSFTDLDGFTFALERDLQRLTESRSAFLDTQARLSRIARDAKPEDVDAAGRCGACVVGGGERRNFFFETTTTTTTTTNRRDRDRVMCHHCLAQPDLVTYEDAVFGRQASDEHVRGGARGRVARADVGAGRSAPSSAETALRFLLGRVSKDTHARLHESGSAHCEALELMRREFRSANVLQKHQRDEMHARDELVMATTRIRTRRDDEIALGGLPDPVPEHLRASVVHEWELGEMETQYVTDRAVYEADLRRAASQVRFLERLRREDEETKATKADAEEANGTGTASDTTFPKIKTFECPVCQEDASSSAAAAELAVLPCGHKLCVSCTDALIARAPPPTNNRHPKSFKCPTCREKTPADEINYVSFGGAQTRVERFFARDSSRAVPSGSAESPAKKQSREKCSMDSSLGTDFEQNAFESSAVVKGSWGTKIEAVTRRALYLLDENRSGADPETKIIVFSEWEDALRVTAAALRANGVVVAHPGGGGKKMRDAVEAFAAKRSERLERSLVPGTGTAGALGVKTATTDNARESEEARVLLMPLRRGANGLNLTSAQHVILLEPVMDPGAEAQAMKRVDRIGQTKPTFVHRFLLLNTVEENVQALSRRRRENANARGDDEAGGARGGHGVGLRVSEARLLVEGASATSER